MELLTITFDNGEHRSSAHMHGVDEAHEEDAAQVEEKVEALVDLHRNLIGQNLGDRHRDSHYH